MPKRKIAIDPDVLLALPQNLPPLADATPVKFSGALMDCGAAMVLAGYDADMVARLFIRTGAMLALSVRGQARAIFELKHALGALNDGGAVSPLDGPVGGHA